MLILNDDGPQIASFLGDGVSAFLHNSRHLNPSAVALYSSPVNGWISLCVDTVDHGAAPQTNCPDFSYPEYRLLELPRWAEEYGCDHPTVQRHDRSVQRLGPDDGDDDYNEAFYLLLMKISNDHYHHDSGVFRPQWAGVQILDSKFASFWRVNRPTRNPQPLS